MKKLIFIISLILLQNTVTFAQLAQEIENKHSIFFAPFNTLDLINPSLQIGYERKLNENYSFQIEGAYILNHSIPNYIIDLLQ